VAQSLLAAAEEWLQERGSSLAVGPVNPGPHYEMGVLTLGFDAPPHLMLTHNPPYYPALLEAAGYGKAVDLYAWWLPTEALVLDGKVRRVGEALKRRYALTVRGGDGGKFAREAAVLERIYNASMQGQWGFTPIDSAEFAALAADMQRILDPDLVLFAEHRGEPVGFLLALPNLNDVLIRIRDGRLFPRGLWTLLRHRKRVRSVRVILAGMLPAWQRRGLGSLLYTEIGHRVVGKGYAGAELSWVLEDNVLMNRAAELLGAKVHKTWRVYQKALSSGGLL
jgi:GNAT superfamily N-acetyltransferase